MTSSKYTLGGEYYRTDIIGDVSTVIRLPVTPAPQSVIDTAVSSGNLNSDGSINYVKFFGDQRRNYEQLAAPSSWMGELANNPSYWSTINQSIGGEIANVAFSEETSLLSSVDTPNKDANQDSTLGNKTDLRYPLNNDGSYDYLLITTYKYDDSKPGDADRLLSGQGFNVELRRSFKDGPTIALPMHPGISDSNSVDWGADQLNPLQLVGARAAGGLMEGLSNLDPGAAASKAFAVLRNAASGVVNDVTEADIKAYFAGQAVGANIFTRATGKVINPNLELLFRGPQLRTFNYNYRFTPRDDDEARVIRSIIRHFKKNMAVKKSNSGLFLQTPNVFELKYIYSSGGQHPFLNTIKKCALTNFNVDYTPDGSYMTYRDGSMTSYSVSMQFSELTPIYEDDYDKGPGKDGMGY
jgi:hypothetical protein